MAKTSVQVIFSEEEMFLIEEAIARKGIGKLRGFVANRARLLLLSWAVEVCRTPGAVRGSACACGAPNASYLNRVSRFFVCAACAERLNAGQLPSELPLCMEGGPDRFVPVAATEAALEKALAAENARRAGPTKADRLAEAVLAAVAEYQKKEESTNADMVGLFKTA
jgi:hypothetical protein